jgi:hypothetical protein
MKHPVALTLVWHVSAFLLAVSSHRRAREICLRSLTRGTNHGVVRPGWNRRRYSTAAKRSRIPHRHAAQRPTYGSLKDKFGCSGW